MNTLPEKHCEGFAPKRLEIHLCCSAPSFYFPSPYFLSLLSLPARAVLCVAFLQLYFVNSFISNPHGQKESLPRLKGARCVWSGTHGKRANPVRESYKHVVHVIAEASLEHQIVCRFPGSTRSTCSKPSLADGCHHCINNITITASTWSTGSTISTASTCTTATITAATWYWSTDLLPIGSACRAPSLRSRPPMPIIAIYF